MEAVWRRILILVAVGVLLTILAFPIVRGERGSGTLKDEHQRPLIGTAIITEYFGPIDSDETLDGKPDLYQDYPEEWIFEFLLVEVFSNGTIGRHVTNVPVWLNLTMDPYSNCTLGYTNSKGIVSFQFKSRLTDTETGNTFTISTERSEQNLTFRVEFNGTYIHRYSSLTCFCTYNRWGGEYEHDDLYHRPDWVEQILDLIALFLPILGIGIFLALFILPIVGFSSYMKRKKV
jgi:hypothetical protein